MWKDDATAQDLLLAARALREFVQGMTRDQFLDDFKTQCAVVQQITVLGEATKRLSPDYRATHPSIIALLDREPTVRQTQDRQNRHQSDQSLWG